MHSKGALRRVNGLNAFSNRKFRVKHSFNNIRRDFTGGHWTSVPPSLPSHFTYQCICVSFPVCQTLSSPLTTPDKSVCSNNVKSVDAHVEKPQIQHTKILRKNPNLKTIFASFFLPWADFSHQYLSCVSSSCSASLSEHLRTMKAGLVVCETLSSGCRQKIDWTGEKWNISGMVLVRKTGSIQSNHCIIKSIQTAQNGFHSVAAAARAAF